MMARRVRILSLRNSRATTATATIKSCRVFTAQSNCHGDQVRYSRDDTTKKRDRVGPSNNSEQLPSWRVLAAWWDDTRGGQISAMAERTTLADGNTWHQGHLGLLGLVLTSPPAEAHALARHLADYVLIWADGADLGKARRWGARRARGCDERVRGRAIEVTLAARVRMRHCVRR
jgi:hypothetical protein